jgi:GNAT superfamily N-acetyltransferase
MNIDRLEYLGFARVLRRGSGEILAEQADALLIRDRVSGAYLLACEDAAVALPLLDRFAGPDCRLLMVSNEAIGAAAFGRYGFTEKLECFQAAYYGEKPAEDPGLRFRRAEAGDLPLLLEYYRRISPEELAQVVSRGSVLLGYDGDRLVGFIGEHLEGSMGLLYVLPEYRRRGWGAALQKRLLAETLDAGFLPFGQVEQHNLASLRLQKKLGMTVSDRLIVWMWK